MLTLQETTEWRDGSSSLNHTYITDDRRSRMLGYIPHGTTKAIMFSSPIQWDIRGRTFTIVKHVNEQLSKEQLSRTVIGSKGEKYTVTQTETGLVCSCKGFQFRGQCKHAVLNTQCKHAV